MYDYLQGRDITASEWIAKSVRAYAEWQYRVNTGTYKVKTPMGYDDSMLDATVPDEKRRSQINHMLYSLPAVYQGGYIGQGCVVPEESTVCAYRGHAFEFTYVPEDDRSSHYMYDQKKFIYDHQLWINDDTTKQWAAYNYEDACWYVWDRFPGWDRDLELTPAQMLPQTMSVGKVLDYLAENGEQA